MKKIIKEYESDYIKVIMFRSIVSSKFKFTIEIIDLMSQESLEEEYLAESIFDCFEEIIQEYDFNQIIN